MKEKICPITVAQAAPAIPQSQTKIKMGSRMVLIIAPTTMQTIEYFGFPSVIIGNVYGVCCPVNISTEHIEFSRLRKMESVTL